MAPQGSDILGLLGYVSLALLVILCVLVIVHAFLIPMDSRRHATCGGCGYPLTDVSAGRCPECGGLLVRMGVVTPLAGARLRSSAPKLVLAWSALLAALLPMAFNRLMPLLNVPPTPIGQRVYVEHEFRSVATARGGEPAYTFRVGGDIVRAFNGALKSGSVTFWREEGGSLVIDAATSDYKVFDADGSTIAKGTGIDAAGVAAFFQAGGLSDSPPGEAEVADLVVLASGYMENPEEFAKQLQRSYVGALPQRPLRAHEYAGGNMPRPETVFADPALSRQTIVVAFWAASALSYLIGLAVMLWLRRRLLVAVTPGRAPS